MKSITQNRNGSVREHRAAGRQPTRHPDQKAPHRDYTFAASLYSTICAFGIVFFWMGVDLGMRLGGVQ